MYHADKPILQYQIRSYNFDSDTYKIYSTPYIPGGCYDPQAALGGLGRADLKLVHLNAGLYYILQKLEWDGNRKFCIVNILDLNLSDNPFLNSHRAISTDYPGAVFKKVGGRMVKVSLQIDSKGPQLQSALLLQAL